MGRVSWVWLLGVALGAACGDAGDVPPPPRAEPVPIFRMISIQPYGQIHLSRPFEHRTVADSVAPQVYRLRSEAYGGADRIYIRTDEGDTVRAMVFTYEPDTYDARVADYTGTLGAPRSVAGSDSTAREAWWSDGLTRFGITEGRGEGAAVTAVLLDGAS